MTMNIVGFEYDVLGNNLLQLSIHPVYWTGLMDMICFFYFLKFDLSQFVREFKSNFLPKQININQMSFEFNFFFIKQSSNSPTQKKGLL